MKQKQKTNMAKVIREIKRISKNSDLLYVVNELDFHTAQYYFDEKRVYIYNSKTYEDIPNYIGKIFIPKDKLVRRLPYFPRKAFILNPDSTYSIQTSY